MRIEFAKAETEVSHANGPGTADCVTVRAPAKLNLFLEVLGKRDDGFHEIETLMCPISLHDEVSVTPTETNDLRLTIELADAYELKNAANRKSVEETTDPAWQIPAGPNNLVLRAVELLRKELGVSDGLHIHLRKKIPAAAGMGGGSSDAASVVVACLALWNRWDRQLATSVCSELGSDIPFFLGNEDHIGLAIGRGRGEQMTMLDATPELNFIVTHPPSGCSTKKIYENFQKLAKPRSVEKIISACEAGQTQKIGAALFNALQSSASRSSEWIEAQIKLFSDSGFEFVLMTGSGSSCFALLPLSNASASLAGELAEHATRMGINRVYSCSSWYTESIEQQLNQR